MTVPNALSKNDRMLADYLIQHGKVQSNAIRAAEYEKDRTGDDFGTILVRNGFLRQKDLVQARIDLNLDKGFRGQVVVQAIDPQFLLDTRTIIVGETDERLFVATLSPREYVRRRIAEFDPRHVEFVSMSMQDLAEYLDTLMRVIAENEDSLMEKILHDALYQEVSDIHIIPRQHTFTVMFRHLGVRRIYMEGDIDEYHTLVARIKDNARMDLSERRIPQSGGFSIEYKNTMIDLRVEALPVATGEYIVIRVLNPDTVVMDLDSLGITRIDQWRQGVARIDGLCLICGPTGSGKTTTLNATIRALNRFERSIFTIEDPVEYRISYVGQVNVNPAVQLDFSRALRSFMRADPDVIIIGEVRDEETAINMLKAAETGHLVLATLHTESIFGAITRLRDIGINANDLRHLLRSVLVQRLIRTLCKKCEGKGCQWCHESGYAGRVIVSECAYFHDEHSVGRLLKGERSWPTLVEDAVEKYRAGITDKRELIRVFAGEAEAILKKNGGRARAFEAARKEDA